MSSLKQLTEQATTDRQDPRKLAHLKTFSFYIFYLPDSGQSPSNRMQKLSLKLRDEREKGTQGKGGDSGKQIQLQFYNLSCEMQKMQGVLDLKMAGVQSKSKIVGYCGQEQLLELLSRAARMEVDITNIPVILIQTHLTSDFSIFSGWSEADVGAFEQMSISRLEALSRRWIQSAQERVDVWRLRIVMGQGGRLERLVGQDFQPVETGSEFEQLFMSHFSLGYHVRLSRSYQQRRRSPEKRKTNSFIYGWERFKNFCCLGSSNMRASTGAVNIRYVDEKGEEFQILKHLREYEGSEESELEASRVVKSDRDIVSLLVANIDRFHGGKVGEGKPGDGRIQVVLFEGASKWRRIASVKGALVLGIEGQSVEMQVGESVFRCWGARQVRIQHASRIKVAINHEVLEC